MSEKAFRPIGELTFHELLQAVAINSDQATYFFHKLSENEAGEADDRAYANQCYDRRNECMRELLRRHESGDPS